MRAQSASRRRLFRTLLTVGAVAVRANADGQITGGVSGFDHVAVPMQNTEAMISFYRRLGFSISENPNAVSVYIGNQMINFHRPSRWQDPAYTLRAPAARPPCGDFCFVWSGSAAALQTMMDNAGVNVELGPVDRPGGRQKTGSSTYVRDPDGNLLEFMIYS